MNFLSQYLALRYRVRRVKLSGRCSARPANKARQNGCSPNPSSSTYRVHGSSIKVPT